MSTGRDIKFAYDQAATWGTAVDVNTSGAEVLQSDSGDFLAKPEQLPDNTLGNSYIRNIDNGNVNVVPSPSGFLYHEGQALMMLTHVIGSDSSAQVNATADYDHTMDPVVKPSLFGTYVYDDGVVRREIKSFKPSGFNIRGESGGFYTWTFNGRGDDILTSSQTNTSISSATATTETLKATFGETELVINDESAGSLSSPTDRLCPIVIEIDFQRDQAADYTACGASDGGVEFLTDQPLEEGPAILTINLEFPEYSNVTLLDDLRDGSTKKMTIINNGPLTGESGSQRYSFTWSFPSLKIQDITTATSDFGRIVKSMTLQGLQASSAPTGLSGITDLFRLIIRNQRTTDYDA